MKKSKEREIAVYALMDITLDGGYNNIVLRKTLQKNDALTQTQKAFITELVNGVLRNLLLIDHIINQFSRVQTGKMKPLILNILRISVYQIKWMDKTPDFAVLNEAVNIAREKGFSNLTGFVNGVLRNILRNPDKIALPDRDGNPAAYLSVLYSYPLWMTEKLIDYFDGDISETERMMIANNRPPKLSVCVNPLKTTAEKLSAELTKEGVTVAPGKSPHALLLSGTANIVKLKAFQDGWFHVIDESAMMAVHRLNPEKGRTMIDLCSAPGGKAFMAAYLMANAGEILSVDIHEHKIALIEQSAARLGIDIIKTKQLDATVFHQEYEEKADVLLIDAPCSGLGLLRKKPDIKYTKTADDIQNLAKLQREILSASWRYLKKGGTLVYSTCTLTKEENEGNMAWLTANFPFSPDNSDGESAFMTILPQTNDTDGFFIARLKRGSE